MTTTYDSNVFHGGTVPIGNAIWRRNSFSKCRLIVDAMPAEFDGNSIDDCQVAFVPGSVTPTQFADWVEPKEPALAAWLRDWVAKGGWKPPTLN